MAFAPDPIVLAVLAEAKLSIPIGNTAKHKVSTYEAIRRWRTLQTLCRSCRTISVSGRGFASNVCVSITCFKDV
jgi:hypothetical protein